MAKYICTFILHKAYIICTYINKLRTCLFIWSFFHVIYRNPIQIRLNRIKDNFSYFKIWLDPGPECCHQCSFSFSPSHLPSLHPSISWFLFLFIHVGSLHLVAKIFQQVNSKLQSSSQLKGFFPNKFYKILMDESDWLNLGHMPSGRAVPRAEGSNLIGLGGVTCSPSEQRR